MTSFLLQIESRYRLTVFQNKLLRFEHINKPVFKFACDSQRSFGVDLHVGIKNNCFTSLSNHNTSIKQRSGHFCYLFQTWLHLPLPFTTTLHFNSIANADNSETIPSHAIDSKTALSFWDYNLHLSLWKTWKHDSLHAGSHILWTNISFPLVSDEQQSTKSFQE